MHASTCAFDVAGDDVLEHLLATRGSLGFGCVEYVLVEVGQRPLTGHDRLAELTLPAGVPCCDRVDELLWHVGIAAAMWEDIFEDDVTLILRYCFADVSAPDGTATAMDGQGRPTEGRIRIPYDWPLWWDSTPNDADEFDMTPRLYRDTHPADADLSAHLEKKCRISPLRAGVTRAGPSRGQTLSRLSKLDRTRAGSRPALQPA